MRRFINTYILFSLSILCVLLDDTMVQVLVVDIPFIKDRFMNIQILLNTIFKYW
jgi:hypothetical protein